MKFTLAFVCIVGAVLVANTNAQFSPFMPGFGLGFPGMPFFPATFGRVFAPYMPHMRPGLLFRGRMLTLGMGLPGIGKRDVDSQIDNSTTTIVADNSTAVVHHVNRTLCTISTATKSIVCKGLKVEHTFECPVVPKLTGILETLRLRLADLIVKIDESSSKVELLKLVTRKSQGKFTFVHPTTHKEEVLVVRHSKDIKTPGFWVEDAKCFQKVVRLVKDVQPEKFRLILNIN